MSPEFLITTLVVCVTPGIGVLYTMAAGLAHGARASLVAAAACTLGIVPHIAAAVTGAAALMHTSALAFQTLKYLGVGYLMFMAWSTLREHGALHVDEAAAPRTTRAVLRDGIVLNLLNPKLTIFFFAFLPQFVERGDTLSMLWLSAVFMAVTFAVFALYGMGAAAVRRHVAGRPAVMIWMRRVFAGSFVVLGVRLATTTR